MRAGTINPDNTFGILGGAGAIGYVFGPAIGGIAGELDTRLPFFVAAAFALSGTAVGYFLLKETLPQDKRRPFNILRANPIGSLLQMSRIPTVFACLIAAFFLQLGAQAQLSIWVFWGELSFGWSPSVSGLTVSA